MASRNAESVEEKWDPLTKSAQTTCRTLLFAEDRAKLVKSKKLGPLVQKCKEADVVTFKCGRCTASFSDKDDFEKHEKFHSETKVASRASIEPASSAGVKRSSCGAVNSSQHGEGHEEGDGANGGQKLKNKVDGVARKATSKTVKKKIEIRRSLLAIRSSKSKKTGAVGSANKSSSKKCSQTKHNSGHIETVKSTLLKRKVDGTKWPKTKATNGGDTDSSPTKKRKTSVRLDDGEGGSFEERTPPLSVDDCEPTTKQRAPSCGQISDGNFAKTRFSINGDGESYGSADKKSSQVKKARKRRLPKADDDDEKGEDTYTCAHCMRNFGRKSNLKRHMIKLHCTAKRANADEGAGRHSTSSWFTGYCCDVCGEGLQHRPTMMAHRDVVHGAQSEIDWVKYQTSLARVKFCEVCKKYFRAGRIFEEHECDRGRSINDEKLAARVRAAEEARPTFACSLCCACFRWKWDYRLHRESKHSDAAAVDWASVEGRHLAHLCESCCKAYPSADELRAHECAADVRQQRASCEEAAAKQYRCKLCGNEYYWKSDYRRHMRIKHPKENYRPTEHDTIVYACPYCGDKFTLKKGILSHMRKAHNANSDSPFVCVKCNKVFRRRDNLDRHNEAYHPTMNDANEVHRILSDAEIRINGDVTYHCAVCNRNIANSNRFVSHYRAHYSENKFECDLCGKRTRTQHQLNTHIKNIHLNIRNYGCDLCAKSFYTKQACEEHRRIHTGERPFSCEICGKTFVAGNALISHKRFHNDFYPHACHLCPKKFKVRRSLINHVRTHTGERPFECDLCAKTFNNSSQYSYHKKVTHSDDRPYSCPVCGNRFKANKFLTRHMELHDSAHSVARGRRTKSRLSSGSRVATATDSAMDGDSPVAAASDIGTKRSAVQLFVSTPVVASTKPLADVPSIVSVVSTMPSPFLKPVNAMDDDAQAAHRDENILPGSPRPSYSAQESNYEPSYNSVKRSAIRNSNPTPAYMTTVEYVRLPDGEYKTVISNQTYTSVESQHGAGNPKNISWL